VQHKSTDEAILRLMETKHDTMDASRKSRHSPANYGKVIFLTPYGNRMHLINDDGTPGAVVDFEDMENLLAVLEATRPEVEAGV
jgi:hypothetical protein